MCVSVCVCSYLHILCVSVCLCHLYVYREEGMVPAKALFLWLSQMLSLPVKGEKRPS